MSWRRCRGNGAGRVMRSLVGSVVHLSQSLRANRADHGDHDEKGRPGFNSRLATLLL